MSEAHFDSALWLKAGASSEGGCVEMAITTSLIGVRDTDDDGSGPLPGLGRSAWTPFGERSHRASSRQSRPPSERRLPSGRRSDPRVELRPAGRIEGRP